MKIKITNKHKSIQEKIEFELPTFTVLTGENGSGKTHLFEAISDSKNTEVSINGNIINSINFIPFGRLTPQVDQPCNPVNIAQKAKQLWALLPQSKSQIDKGYIGPFDKDPALSRIGNVEYKKSIINISIKSGITPSMLTEGVIFEFIDMVNISTGSLFYSQLALIFKSYHLRQIDNKLNKIYMEDHVVDAMPYLEDEEFISKFGAEPWVFINSILRKMKLPYEVNNPIGTRRDVTFVFKLINRESREEISINDLSTGEKTLMSLALAIYNSADAIARIDFLILDEPDAPLHPSMSKLMLEIIEDEIVKKYKIPVLLSTHSPTTIACAPANSLYKISGIDKKPTPCSLEDSMGILTYGIPNLRVSIEDRRQVFVEHSYDVDYYEALFRIISREHRFVTVPQFLPPHTNNGSNCSAVLNITRQLRDMGNKQVYGLIDWDKTNKAEKQIIILGGGKRYAIENYIFEPHFIGLYLISKSFLDPSVLGLVDCNSYVDVVNKLNEGPSVSMLQTIVDVVQSKISWISSEIKIVKSKLINGSILNIRQEILLKKGHDLESLVKKTWPELNSIRQGNQGDSALKKDMINTVINDFPSLCSKDLLETFTHFK